MISPLATESYLMSTFSIRPTLTAAALVAALALFVGMQFGTARSQPVLSLKNSVPSITTNGVASTEVVPDIATILLGVDTGMPNAADAVHDDARAAQAIVGEIKAQGIEEKDIRTLSVTLSPDYDEVSDANGRVTKRTLRGYIAHNERACQRNRKGRCPGAEFDGQGRQQF